MLIRCNLTPWVQICGQIGGRVSAGQNFDFQYLRSYCNSRYLKMIALVSWIHLWAQKIVWAHSLGTIVEKPLFWPFFSSFSLIWYSWRSSMFTKHDLKKNSGDIDTKKSDFMKLSETLKGVFVIRNFIFLIFYSKYQVSILTDVFISMWWSIAVVNIKKGSPQLAVDSWFYDKIVWAHLLGTFLKKLWFWSFFSSLFKRADRIVIKHVLNLYFRNSDSKKTLLLKFPELSSM